MAPQEIFFAPSLAPSFSKVSFKNTLFSSKAIQSFLILLGLFSLFFSMRSLLHLFNELMAMVSVLVCNRGEH